MPPFFLKKHYQSNNMSEEGADTFLDAPIPNCRPYSSPQWQNSHWSWWVPLPESFQSNANGDLAFKDYFIASQSLLLSVPSTVASISDRTTEILLPSTLFMWLLAAVLTSFTKQSKAFPRYFLPCKQSQAPTRWWNAGGWVTHSREPDLSVLVTHLINVYIMMAPTGS